MSEPETYSQTAVASNETTLKALLVRCDNQTLRTCLLVNRKWYNISRIVIQRRATVTANIAPYFLDQPVNPRRFPNLRIGSKILRQLHEDFEARELYSAEAFVNPLMSFWRRSKGRPYYVIIFEGIEQTMRLKPPGKKWLRESFLDSLGPELPPECPVTGIASIYGVIGKIFERPEDHDNEPLTLSFTTNHIPGMVGLILPKLDGFTVKTILTSEYEDGPFTMLSDIKALIVLSTEADELNGLTPHDQVNHIFHSCEGQLALGGAHLDSVEFPEYQHANGMYHFINGLPPYKRKRTTKFISPMALIFSGQNVQAASLYIEKRFDGPRSNSYNDKRDLVINELLYIKERLQEFRSRLTFPCDSDDDYETIGFLFFNHHFYHRFKFYTDTLNIGTGTFFDVFPRTLITGALCHSLWKYNFVPDVGERRGYSDPGDELQSEEGMASFVLISIRKTNFSS